MVSRYPVETCSYLFLELLLLGFLLLDCLLSGFVETEIVQNTSFARVLLEDFYHLKSRLQLDLQTNVFFSTVTNKINNESN